MKEYNTIINCCKNGESKAQMVFYNLFYKSVYNSSLRILGNGQEAEEVMQETFLKVFNKPQLLEDHPESMRRVLNRIAINHSIDIYRKRKVTFAEISEKEYFIEDEAEEDWSEIQLAVIRDTIKLLPEGYRIIFTLHVMENMGYDEISEKLQVTPSNVRSQFARAKQKLIALIKKHRQYENITGR